MQLEDLEIYSLAREISHDSWDIYNILPWQTKKILGDQFIRAVDSVGANIAEGWGRFHFLDKNRFNYNARGSLIEAQYWLELLIERNIVMPEIGASIKTRIAILRPKLNNYINATKKQVGK